LVHLQGLLLVLAQLVDLLARIVAQGIVLLKLLAQLLLDLLRLARDLDVSADKVIAGLTSRSGWLTAACSLRSRSGASVSQIANDYLAVLGHTNRRALLLVLDLPDHLEGLAARRLQARVDPAGEVMDEQRGRVEQRKGCVAALRLLLRA